MIPEALALCDRDMRSDGIVYMDARKYVCAGVAFVKYGNRRAERIFFRIDERPEVGTVFKEGTDNQADRHSREKEAAHADKIVLAFKKEKHHRARDIEKPHQVGDDEILIKRNVVIHGNVNDMIVSGHRFFQIAKPGQVEKAVG